MTVPTSKPRPGRRTLVKGAAWSVPAVAVASHAPALAASPVPVTPDTPRAFGCKWPGGAANCTDPLDKGFRIFIPFDNNTGFDVIVTISGQQVTSGGTCSRDFQSWEAGPAPSDGVLVIPAGSEADYWVTWHDDNSGNNKTLTVTYTYTITSGSSAGTVFGPFSVPVAKVFNQTCEGLPEPTILTGDCGEDCSALSTESSTTDAAPSETADVDLSTEGESSGGESVTDDTEQPTNTDEAEPSPTTDQ